MFSSIKNSVQRRFEELLRGELFVVDLEKNQLFEAYLDAFSLDRRQEHNCNCCQSFLNHYGNLVSIQNGVIKTLWEFEGEGEYAAVPSALDRVVRNAAVTDAFVSKIRELGTDFNHQRLSDDVVIRWDHFFLALPNERRFRNSESVDSAMGRIRDQRGVFKRGLEEITLDSVETVLELIAQNSLYRGAEFKTALEKFKAQKLEAQDLELYSWEHWKKSSGIRNSVIGTLLQDLSAGRELDASVASYEAKVAPGNYRRPTALVTKGMLEKAEKELTESGLLPALSRRHATTDDIPVSKVLFVDRSAGVGSLFDDLKGEVITDPRTFSRVEEVPIDRFIKEVLPTATGLEVLMEGKHSGNLVNLTAAADPKAPTLFNWESDVAWVYKDGAADSVKARVKNAGGSVDGVLRISLDWYNTDDLDLHVVEPDGDLIYHGYKRSDFGFLDVDMNVGSAAAVTDAVENVIYKTQAPEGRYIVKVKNYTRRNNTNTGFGIEIECNGETFNFSSSSSPRNQETDVAVEFTYSKASGVKILAGIERSGATSKDIFGIKTNVFQKVSMVLPSPNYWGEKVSGNLHTFFIIDEAKTDEPIRGFFNEFLKPELNALRKVFELLGEKTKIPASGQQLAGLGFSSTQPAELICRVKGSFTRVIKVKV